MLQKNKVVVVNLPEEYEDYPEYTQDQLYELLNERCVLILILFLTSLERNLSSLVEVTSDSVTLKASWEGPGEYDVLLDGSSVLPITKIFKTLLITLM